MAEYIWYCCQARWFFCDIPSPSTKEQYLSKLTITGWIISVGGLALWLYGYFSTGHAPVLDWHAYTPWWIADYLPNINSEIGMVLMFGGTALTYWPPQRR